MVGSIDALSPVAAPQAQAPAKASPVQADGPDLRDTQAAILAAQKSAAADAQKNSTQNGAERELEDALNERLAKFLRSNVRMRVEIDKGTGDFVYKSIDKKTGEIDRQWPAESMLRMLAFFKELDGLLYDKKA